MINPMRFTAPRTAFLVTLVMAGIAQSAQAQTLAIHEPAPAMWCQEAGRDDISVRARLLDSQGYGVPDETVYFAPVGPTRPYVDPTSDITDDDGYALTTYHSSSCYSGWEMIRAFVATPPPLPAFVYVKVAVKPTVTDGGACTTSTSALSASWTPGFPPYTYNQYAIGLSSSDPGSNYVRGWTSLSPYYATSVTATGLDLDDGQTYYFYVKTSGDNSCLSPAGASDGIKVDATAPTCTITPGSGYQTESPVEFTIEFSEETTEDLTMNDVNVAGGLETLTDNGNDSYTLSVTPADDC